MRCLPNAGSIMAQCRGFWANDEPTSGECITFSDKADNGYECELIIEEGWNE